MTAPDFGQPVASVFVTAMTIAAAAVAVGAGVLIYQASKRSNPLTSDDATDVRRRVRKIYYHASVKSVREELRRVNDIFERAAKEKTDREGNEVLWLARVEEKELAEMLREKLAMGRANPRRTSRRT